MEVPAGAAGVRDREVGGHPGGRRHGREPPGCERVRGGEGEREGEESRRREEMEGELMK
jgi:hypothetical protein